MKYTSSFFLTLILAMPVAHAGSLIECQNDRGETILQLRAEKRRLRGAPSYEPGGWWMQYHGKMYPGPLGEPRGEENVDARSPDKTEAEITIQHAIAATGPVGQKIRLRELDTDTPKLWTITFGGFVGRLEMGPFRCVKIDNPCAKALSPG